MADASKWERAWDKFVVQIFRDYTRRWSRESRKNFWWRICSTDPLRVRHLPGQMTMASIAATKSYNDSTTRNRESTIDPDEDRAF